MSYSIDLCCVNSSQLRHEHDRALSALRLEKEKIVADKESAVLALQTEQGKDVARIIQVQF